MRMLIVHTCIMWSHDQRWDIVHLDGWSSKVFYLLGVLSALIFILWGCCPMVFLSISPFLCLPTWPHDENVDCPQLYHVITWPSVGYRTPWFLEGKIFSSFGGFVRFDFYPLWLLSYGAFVHYGFSLSAHVTAWRECWLSTPVSCDHMTRDGISYTLMVGVVKYFHLLLVLSELIFIFWGCCPMVLLSILAFLCLPTWPHDENVDCPHLYHVITCPEMGYRTPWFLEGKIFSSFVGFVRLDFFPLWLLSYGAFVHYGYSLSAHMTAWLECWLSTPVSCDHMTRDEISYTLTVRVVKYFHLFGGFVRLDFYALALLSYGAFVHFWLFSVRPRDRMTRMLIVHTCVMWSHDQRWDIVHLEGWSSKIFSSFGGFVFLDFYPLGLLSYGAFVHYGFSVSAHVTAWRECWLSTPVSGWLKYERG